MERIESDLCTSKAHDDSEDDLEPCALNHKGNKELCVVGEKKRRKDKEVTAPDLGSVLSQDKQRKILEVRVVLVLLSHFLLLTHSSLQRVLRTPLLYLGILARVLEVAFDSGLDDLMETTGLGEDWQLVGDQFANVVLPIARFNERDSC